jgi:hypothetical protein
MRYVKMSEEETMLTGSLWDQPARIRAIQNTIAWSYYLLALEEQTLVRRRAR